MAKINFIMLIFLALINFSRPALKEFQINFDYSNLNIQELYLTNIFRFEFDKIVLYFKNFLLHPNPEYSYKTIKKKSKDTLKCDNPKINLNYSKKNIYKNTSLLIFPRISINPNVTKLNNPIFTECIKKGTNSIVIILDFEFKTENQMKRMIPLNFKNQKYQWATIRYILSSIGFNKNSFAKLKISNNSLLKDRSLLENYNFFASYEKFSFLTNLTTVDTNQNEKFLDFWPAFPKFDDLMIKNFNPRSSLPSITEMTLGALENLGYKVSPCELILYENKCYRVNHKCLNQFNFDDYFLEYTLDIKNNRWICYYKTQEHFKNKQCSNDYGVLLSNKEINKNLLIDYFRKNDFQTIRLIKPAPSCPKPHPRTVYYMTVKEKEDPYQYKILDRVEEVTIKDPNYFIITNTFSYSYEVKSRAALYNNILATYHNKEWNFNYLWVILGKYDNITGVNLEKNKYQFIGKFPFDNTFKDGLNRFYNKQKAKFPEDYNYIPETYLFPDQKEEIYLKFKDYHYNAKDVWLLKPARGLMALGIKIVDNYDTIKNYKHSSFLVSRYVMNPLLLNNKKFDMRAYILVTGMNPLKIYFYRDGYIKISVKDFTLDHEHINDGCIHITTSDTNLECFDGKEYKYDTDIYDAHSHFWSYMHFERYCAKRGINYTEIMEQMKDIFIKTFISLNSDFINIMKERKKYDRNLYQLYGLDLMVDINNKVHLLELNRNPSMRNGHGVCDYMYDNLIADILNIVGIVPFNHETKQTYDKDIYVYNDETEEIVDECLCEFGRPRGMFELAYPLRKNINRYKKFYERILPESQMLWDKLLESNGEYD